jgi:tRNA dimethylallyltransferase
MFQRGLVDEVRGLVARGYAEAAPMRSVGYVQAKAVVDGRLSLEEAIAQAAQETRHYAKRQLTWFRKEAGARFIEPPYDVDALLKDEGAGA